MNVDVLIGDWDVVIDHRMVDGTVAGRQTFTPILGGKFLQLDWHVDHPDFPTHRNILNDEQLYSFDDRGIVRDGYREIPVGDLHQWIDAGWNTGLPELARSG